MDIFLSWSGERSKQVAQALKEWLPLIRDDLDPWVSDRDIHAGERWSIEVGRRLENSNFGIICLTRENRDATWIMFEAGALSKILDEGHVCPYLLDVEMSEILTSPLSQFQAKKTDKQSTLDLLQSINSTSTQHIAPDLIMERFEMFWPRLEAVLDSIGEARVEERPSARSTEQTLEELVEVIRATDRRLGNLETRLLFPGAAAATVLPEGVSWAVGTTTTVSWWDRVIHHLRASKEAAAAIYEGAIARFDGEVLSLSFPEELEFYARLARDDLHADPLKEAMEEVHGVRPTEIRSEVRSK